MDTSVRALPSDGRTWLIKRDLAFRALGPGVAIADAATPRAQSLAAAQAHASDAPFAQLWRKDDGVASLVALRVPPRVASADFRALHALSGLWLTHVAIEGPSFTALGPALIVQQSSLKMACPAAVSDLRELATIESFERFSAKRPQEGAWWADFFADAERRERVEGCRFVIDDIEYQYATYNTTWANRFRARRPTEDAVMLFGAPLPG